MQGMRVEDVIVLVGFVASRRREGVDCVGGLRSVDRHVLSRESDPYKRCRGPRQRISPSDKEAKSVPLPAANWVTSSNILSWHKLGHSL